MGEIFKISFSLMEKKTSKFSIYFIFYANCNKCFYLFRHFFEWRKWVINVKALPFLKCTNISHYYLFQLFLLKHWIYTYVVKLLNYLFVILKKSKCNSTAKKKIFDIWINVCFKTLAKHLVALVISSFSPNL